MRIELVFDKDKKPVGYNIVPETAEDDDDIAVVRNMIFFGFNEDHIEYAGFKSKDPDKGKVVGNIECLMFLKKRLIEN